MGVVVAIAGKGGTGKTTLGAALIRRLVHTGNGPVLAIDADHNASLGLMLGLRVDQTLSDIREQTLKAAENVGEIPKERLLDQWLNQIIVEADGYDLITMGLPEGPGCYCYVNNLLRRYLSLLKRNYPFVVIDNAAGMEHLSRLTADEVQLLLLVGEPTYMGLITARRINELASRLPIRTGRRVLVLNKMGPEGLPPEATEIAESLQVDTRVAVPYSESLARFSPIGGGVAPPATDVASGPIGRLAELCREVAGGPLVRT